MSSISIIQITFNSWNGALNASVPSETRWTRADWLVIHCLTQRIDSTGSDAGVSAFLCEAGFITRTVRIDNAFRINTHSDAIPDSTFAIITARRRIAGISF